MYHRIKQIALTSALLASVVAICLAAGEPGFIDVLDTPAKKSSLVAKAHFNGIAVAGKRLVSVGQRGYIVYSDDQGATWVQASVPVSADLTAVSFPTPGKGWAVGHDGVVLNSTDGGATWSRQLDGHSLAKIIADYYGAHPSAGPDAARLQDELQQYVDKGPDKPLLDVWFENETNGYIVGAFNLIFRTVDGGKSWEPLLDRTDNPKRFHLYGIRPVGTDLYLCGEQGLALKLDRQTGRFRALTVPYNGTLFGITGKPGALIAHGLRGNVFRSADAGTTWKKVETGIPVGIICGTVMDDGRIVLVNQAGNLLVSADNGESFSQAKVEQPFSATSVAPLGDQTVMLAGPRGMRKQTLKQ